MKPPSIIASILVTVTLGYAAVLLIFAAGPAASYLPADGTIAGNASVQTNASAIGGHMLVFGVSATPTPTPTPTTTPTPTPTATPTPTPTPTGSCALPHYPDATCTGVPAGTTLTAASGLTLSTPGQVYDSKDVTGCITVTAANVTIKNSRVKCNDGYGIWSRSTGLLVQDTEVDCNSTTGTGIVGGSFTARRVNVHGCENGASADDNVTIADSYIHDLFEGPGSHVDGIQVASNSTGLLFDHNRILNANSETSAIIGGDSATETVSNNYLSGGGFTLYCSPNFAGFKVFNNRWGRQYWPNGGYYGPYANCDGIGQWSNNVWDDTGLPV